MDRWGRSQKWIDQRLSGVYAEYSATLQADVICRGYVGILLSARVMPWIKVAPRISVLFVLDRKYISVKDVFFETPLTEDITSKEFFLFQRRLRYGVFKTMVAHPAPNNFEYPHCKFPAWFRQAVGISTPEQAKKMANISDGAIVGSAIIKLLEQYGKDAPKYIGEYVKKMKMALLTN